MKILNWNVCSFNKNQQRTIEKALSYNADILCLQEVTPESLIYLKEQNYNLFFINEQKGIKEDYYLVILSKHKFISSETIVFYNKPIKSLVARVVNWYSMGNPNHEALLVNFEISGKEINLCNLHLSWPVTPSVRKEQIDKLFHRLDKLENLIICGDFNTFGGLKYYNILTSLFFSYNPKDFFFNEREWLDNEIDKRNLQNPFKKTRSYSTLPINAQIDHILFPHNITINSKLHDQNSYGSDHTPYFIDLDI